MDHSPASRFSAGSLSPISPGARNEYPFPRLVLRLNIKRIKILTSSRPGSSSDRLYPRRGSTASSIHSIGGTLDTVSQWHGLNESGQNGMSRDEIEELEN